MELQEVGKKYYPGLRIASEWGGQRQARTPDLVAASAGKD